jgi:predicted butyrate kinase (DUF1464 family)
MPRVIGIDPGTVSIDLCGLDQGRVWLDRSLPTREALEDPASFLALLTTDGAPELIAGPSGYGLPLVPAHQASDRDLRLAFLAPAGEAGGIGGLRRLAGLLAESELPVIYTPGVIHLPSVPEYRKLNRVDLGTADKVAAAALGIWDQARRFGGSPADTSFILLELGGAFTAALAVDRGAIVDGVGGTSGPLGWQSSGAWDGEVAFLAGMVEKDLLFRGGAAECGEAGMAAYAEGALKAVLALTAAVPAPREIYLSGRHASEPVILTRLVPRLAAIAPVAKIGGFARIAKEGAQGAALIADGLAGGGERGLVESMGLRNAHGTALDYLRVIPRDTAARRIGAG